MLLKIRCLSLSFLYDLCEGQHSRVDDRTLSVSLAIQIDAFRKLLPPGRAQLRRNRISQLGELGELAQNPVSLAVVSQSPVQCLD